MTEPFSTASTRSLLAILGELSAILQGATGFAEKQVAFFAVLREQLGFDLAWLGMLDGQNKFVQGRGGFVLDGTHGMLTSRVSIVPGEFIDRVTSHRDTFVTANLKEDPRSKAWWAYAREWGIQGAAAFPITFQNQCLGICLLGSRRWGLLLATEEESTLKVLGDLIGAAICQDRAQQESARQSMLTAPLLVLADRLRQPQQMDPVFQTVVDELYSRLTPSRTAIYWLDLDRREFWVRAMCQRFNCGPGNGTRLPLRDLYGLYQELKEDRIVAITDARSDLRGFISQAYLQKFRLLSLLAHPIIYQGDLLGYLAVEQTDQPRVWQSEEHQLVRAMANLLGVTTTQARLYEVTRRQALEQTLINQITRDIRNTLDPDQVLQAAVERLGDSLGVDRCLVLNFSLDEEIEVLHEYRKAGINSARGTVPSPAHELEQRTLNSAVPVAIDDIEADFRFLSWRDYLRTSATRSLMICGTAYQGRPNGILVLQYCYQAHSWTSEEKAIVQAVADQVGIALGQAQLYRRTQEQAEIELRINQVGRAVRAAIPVGQVAPLSLRELSQAMEAPLTAFLLCAPTDEAVMLNHVYSQSDWLRLPRNEALKVADNPFMQAIFGSPEPVELILDPATAPAGPHRLLWQQGVRSILGMRLQAGKQMLGVVLAMNSEPKRWGNGFCQILTRLAGEFALAFSQAEAFEKLQELSQQLQHLNEYKNNMVSISSHEMRTPLASIRAYVETMISEPDLDTAMVQEFMRGMEVECIRLTNLLDDLATLVALESQRAEWQYRVIAVQELLERTLSRSQALATQHEVELRLASAVQADFVVHVDDQKVEQVLGNLLENACKHTHPGCLAVLSATLLAGGDWIEFSVYDNGPGIPANKLESLFQPFVRVQDVMNHSKGGAGLGLAICKEIVDQMGGRIEVQSTVGQGSLFRVVLPVQPPG
jgi:GAF domain-containing protein